MGQTRYFNLSFFDFGERLESPLNVQKEIDRFVIIDKQLYGLYNVFGNGIVNGWTVRDGGFTQNEGINISVSQGSGIIDFMAVETQIPSFLYNLTPNSILDIYAVAKGTTPRDRSVDFIFSTSSDLSSNSFIRIARLATGNNSILYINNNIRDLISFEGVIEDQINQHKHRGTPSKIDLQEEVKNQLSGARIEGIDASKIISGKFDINRIPLIDHNELQNNGMITHAALDSFVQTLSQNNKELLGEVASVNLLKTIIFLKYLYTTVDEHFINEFTFIPGITSNTFIDFNSSTANISLTDNCISGIPTKTGIFTSIYLDTTEAFNTYSYKNNVVIQNDEISLERSEQNIDIVTDFSNNIPFKSEVLTIDDSQGTVIVEDGNKLGRLSGESSFGYYYRLNLTTHKNWTGLYDEIVIKVKTIETVHEPVYMYLINGSNINKNDSNSFGSIEAGNIDGIKLPSSSWVILNKNETMPEFEEKAFDISGLELNDVSQITIYTNSSFIFDIDDILVRRTNLYKETGIVRFRYSSESNVVFHSVYYGADTPEDTSISVRIKTASSSDLLSRSSYSYPMDSGDIFAVEGKAAEIEVELSTNEEKTLSPILSSLELRLLVSADFNGYIVDTDSEWDRGTFENSETQNSSNINYDDIKISSPINVGGRYFSKNSSISEISDINIGILGFSGVLMPVSPNQTRSWTISSNRGFDKVSSVIRKYNKNFLISDVNNNRVLEVDSQGNLIKGFGSTYSIDTDLYPLSAIYNPETEILTIVFTKKVVVNDITKISFYIGSSKLSLTTNEVISTVQKAGGKILEIELSDNIVASLRGVESDLSVNFENGAFSENVVVNEGMTTQGNSIFSVLRGFVCFIGDFTYIDGIRHPVFMNETIDGNWIIANSSIYYGGIDSTKENNDTVPDIFEIDPNNIDETDDKLSITDIKFSDYSLGSILEYEKNKFLVAGIDASSSTIGGITGDEFLEGYTEPIPENILFRAAAIDDLSGHIGKLIFIDKSIGRVQTFYTTSENTYASGIDQLEDGGFVVSESSFSNNAGRIIKLDIYGNVIWSYGSGVFSVINSVKALNNDKLIISV